MKFEFVAGNLALDFANSVHDYGSAEPQDDLKTFADFVRWSQQAGLLSPQQCRELPRKKTARARMEFEHALELRGAVYAMFVSRARGKRVPGDALQQLDRHFREAAANSGLQSAGKRFALTWRGSSSSLQRVRGEITRAAIDLLTSDRLHRVRQCEGETCSWLFLDTSRNGLRRWCDMQACGNRAKVRRYRRRSAAG
jgi:predicted RNA-binding Zn ribbon-like protein